MCILSKTKLINSEYIILILIERRKGLAQAKNVSWIYEDGLDKVDDSSISVGHGDSNV